MDDDTRGVTTSAEVDALVVGAGPTGLTLAAQLQRFGASVAIIDAAVDRARESRALAIQPRTLEVLRPLDVTEELVRRGNPAVRLRLHAGSRAAEVPLFDIGLDDTAYPFLLFLSQAETEAILGAHLAGHGVHVERQLRLESLVQDDRAVTCTLRRGDGTAAQLRARYVIGCDGAHSTVRKQAGISFVGGRYPQTFLLADLNATGLEPGAVNAFLTETGPLFFFPLEHPAPWRLITMRPDETSRPADDEAPASTSNVELGELQAAADAATGGTVALSGPVWTTAFRLHHRHATSYRSGHVFLAGDAAHIHSPAGAQGMNTGIQDAVNLGWKLALVTRGVAAPELLDSYDAERRPVGAFVLRLTDRAFTVVTSPNPILRAVRTHLAPRLLPVALRLPLGRRLAFRTVSQLQIRYRRSPAIQHNRSRLPRGPRPGDRLPDAPLTRDGRPTSLHQLVTAPAYQLLLSGVPAAWDHANLENLRHRHGDLLHVHHLTTSPNRPRSVHDATGLAHARLGARAGTSILLRPDGHIACRRNGFDLAAATRYLDQCLPPRGP